MFDVIQLTARNPVFNSNIYFFSVKIFFDVGEIYTEKHTDGNRPAIWKATSKATTGFDFATLWDCTPVDTGFSGLPSGIITLSSRPWNETAST